MPHLIDLVDWEAKQILKVLKEAARLKKAHLRGKDKPTLAGKVLGLIFEKPSLRTRVSFEAGMMQLGGSSIFLGPETGLGVRESIADCARTLSHFVDAVVLRVFRHRTVMEFAKWATVPVINGLSDYNHPCQALGDLLTMQEIVGDLVGKTVVFVGDGNNVARSLAMASCKVGMRFILAAPKGYGFDDHFQKIAHEILPQASITEETNPQKAVAGADFLYTDVWTSMGQEAETAKRTRDFAKFRIDDELVEQAGPNAKVLHCLPAHRGEEITDSVMDGPHSVVFEQAGNRMHVQKALLERLLLGAE